MKKTLANALLLSLFPEKSQAKISITLVVFSEVIVPIVLSYHLLFDTSTLYPFPLSPYAIINLLSYTQDALINTEPTVLLAL